ncbi:hypothetical protein M408DRAFT_158717 [Serendipita vermifera MAFF 305830]|uniref:Uncharacterized protein n=1 Tax=Serendipita vermifera MAFF 305830 TaxID=933852 RepID=A0A0C3BNM0_SERVB|nr:hypothetical protein M408DRAFT_158717 [Serendipita vermifera MAFF 305830]
MGPLLSLSTLRPTRLFCSEGQAGAEAGLSCHLPVKNSSKNLNVFNNIKHILERSLGCQAGPGSYSDNLPLILPPFTAKSVSNCQIFSYNLLLACLAFLFSNGNLCRGWRGRPSETYRTF